MAGYSPKADHFRTQMLRRGLILDLGIAMGTYMPFWSLGASCGPERGALGPATWRSRSYVVSLMGLGLTWVPTAGLGFAMSNLFWYG